MDREQLEALVLGKPLLPEDADTGYTPAADLATWVQRAARDINWTSGVFCWSWENVSGPAWVKTIYPKAS